MLFWYDQFLYILISFNLILYSTIHCIFLQIIDMLCLYVTYVCFIGYVETFPFSIRKRSCFGSKCTVFSTKTQLQNQSLIKNILLCWHKDGCKLSDRPPLKMNKRFLQVVSSNALVIANVKTAVSCLAAFSPSFHATTIPSSFWHVWHDIYIIWTNIIHAYT